MHQIEALVDAYDSRRVSRRQLMAALAARASSAFPEAMLSALAVVDRRCDVP
jgi:hypothetical protein